MTTRIPGVRTLLCRSDDVLWERPKSGDRHWIFVSQHSNHRSDHIQSTGVPRSNCLYWRLARPLGEQYNFETGEIEMTAYAGQTLY